VCGLIGNLPFVLLYITLGTVSGIGQLAIGGHPVLGAGGAVSGMIGVCIAYFPTNSVGLCYPTPAGLGSRPAPVWALALYWAAWVATAAILHLDATAPWGQLVGMSAGIGLGVVMVLADWVEFTDCDNGPLIVRAPRAHGAAADDRSDEARAALRRLAQQYYEEYAACPRSKSAAPPAPSRRLTLRSSMGFARSAATRAKPTARTTSYGHPVHGLADRSPRRPLLPLRRHQTAWPRVAQRVPRMPLALGRHPRAGGTGPRA
jgi:hypothetical protein